MEPVKQEGHELLGIVLGITCKLTGFTCHNSLQREGVITQISETEREGC